jgi:putative transposase
VKAKLREDRNVAVAANETWAMDLVHDQLATGRKLRVLTVVARQADRHGCNRKAPL